MAIVVEEWGTLPTKKKYRITCQSCKTRFTYECSDIASNGRNESYVTCPNQKCKSYLDHEEKNAI